MLLLLLQHCCVVGALLFGVWPMLLLLLLLLLQHCCVVGALLFGVWPMLLLLLLLQSRPRFHCPSSRLDAYKLPRHKPCHPQNAAAAAAAAAAATAAALQQHSWQHPKRGQQLVASPIRAWELHWTPVVQPHACGSHVVQHCSAEDGYDFRLI
jgi:hypothetical protein